MCDERTEEELERALTRRDLATLAAAGGLALLLPRVAQAKPVRGADVIVETPDGRADAWFVAPEEGRHPAVLIWPDVFGLRPAFRDLAGRLAEAGYAVLVLHAYYRWQPAPALAAGESMGDAEVRKRIFALAKQITEEMTVADARAVLAFLDQQPAVDVARRAATTGYCFGGSMAFRTAAALPERIGAVASFHGGALVTHRKDSPHALVAQTQAEYLVAIAENDDERDPKDRRRLVEAFAAAGRPAEVEVYAGTQHGWCAPDGRSFDPDQAQRAWDRMLALFARAI